jgi:hypothetical protein
MDKLPFDIHSINITFTIPEWFPQDRFDYYTGMESFGNRAEDLFFKRFPDCKEICKESFVTFEFGYVSGIHLDGWIKHTRIKLYKFFSRYKEWDKSIGNHPEFILKYIK